MNTSTSSRSFSRRLAIAAAAAGALVATAVPSAAQPADSVQRIRALYAAAAYEEVLLTLPALDSRPRPELEQYRIFCLVALGRTQDATRAIEAVVAADPMFVPEAGETSPRIHEVFVRTRRQVLPDIARRMYRQAKEALDRRDREAAIDGFGNLLRLIDTVKPADGDPLAEMRLLADGFLELGRAIPPPATAVFPAAAALPPAPPLPEAPRSNAAAPGPITPPVPVEQSLPTWTPPVNASHAQFQGSVRVLISETGAVTDAELVDPVHPAYDPLLLGAARQWTYTPARRGGHPIKSEKIVQVVLKPR